MAPVDQSRRRTPALGGRLLTVHAYRWLTRALLVALFASLAAPVAARAQTPAGAPPVPGTAIPADCRDAGGALVVTTTPFTGNRDKQARSALVAPDGTPLGQFPVPGALKLVPTPVKDKFVVPTATGETWLYDVARGDARRYGGPTGTARDYSNAPSYALVGDYLLVLVADGWDIVDIRSGAQRSLAEIAGPHARFPPGFRNVTANGGADVLLSLAVGSSRNVQEGEEAPASSYPVVVIPGDLARAKLLKGYIYPDATAFSADGGSLALLRAAPGLKEIYVRDLASGKERRVDQFGEETKIGGIAFGGAGLVLLRDQEVVTRPATVGGETEVIGGLDGPVTDGVVSPSGKAMVYQTTAEHDGVWTSRWWHLDLETLTQTPLKADAADVVDGWPRDNRWLLLGASRAGEPPTDWAYALLDTETGDLTGAPAGDIAAFGRAGLISGRASGVAALTPLLADGTARLDFIDGRADRAWSVPIADKENAPYTLTMTSFSPNGECAAISTTTVTAQQPLRTSLLAVSPKATPVPLLRGIVLGWLPTTPKD